MRSEIGPVRSSLSLRVLLLGTVGLAAAGCSNEVTRFSQPMFNGSGGSQYTGSVNPAPSQSVQQASLGASGAQPSYSGVSSAPLAAPTAGASPSYASTAPAAASASANTVVASQSDTVYTIARRYNIPPNALMQANGLSDPAAVSPGQRLVIPTYSASSSSWQAPSQTASNAGTSGTLGQLPASGTAPRPSSSVSNAGPGGGAHVVASGETVYSIGRRYGVGPNQIIAANGLGSPDRIRVGQRLTIPSANVAANEPASRATQVAGLSPGTSPAPKPTQTDAVSQPAAPAESKPAAPEPAEVNPVAYAPADDQQSGNTDASAGLPAPAELSAGSFRWPVRGRVIASYGDKNDGGKNDGVNISVPEGTPVRAAENGVVAYAGSELKGYGNLVLIRHSDDWVTAYAHNSDLDVKRGDTVSRGQVIAKAGQTGNVSSPQVHFELRKGSQPVDPLRHLSQN